MSNVQTYYSGQTATGSISGFQEVLSSGATGYLQTLQAGQIVVFNGANLIQQNPESDTLAIMGNGQVYLYSGGSMVGGYLDAGATLAAEGGSHISGTLVVASGAAIEAINGSLGGTFDSGSQLFVYSGGKASGVIVASGASVYANSSEIASSTINGGYLGVNSGSTATNITLQDGGSAQINSGSYGYNIGVSNGGTLNVWGIASDTVVNNGGMLRVNSGGMTANPSGNVDVASGVGSIVGVTQINTGGRAVIKSNTTISGDLLVDGGSVLGGIITSGNNLYVSSGGAATSVTILNGGSGLVDEGHISSSIVDGGILYVRQGSVASNLTATNSGLLQIQSGSELTSAVIESGATLGTFGSGTAVSNVTVGNQGLMTINTESVGTNLVISSGGNLNVNAAGSATSVHISGGGAIVRGQTSDVDISSGGLLTVRPGGVSTDNIVSAGGSAIVVSGGSLGDTTITSSGAVVTRSGAIITGVLTLQDGGSATIWNDAGGAIVLPGDTNQGLTISGLENGGTVSTVISGWSGTAPGNSDSIHLAGVSASGVSYDYPSNNQVVITLANSSKITINIQDVQEKGFVLVDDGNGGALGEICFLAGSMIATPKGDIAVETLEIGDVVKTWNWQSQSIENRTIGWIGKKRTNVRGGLADDVAGYPVRVLKNAIAEGIPYKDMLITPEHSLFFKNKFVPVRMLVNGRSIFYDRSILSYDYFHIETEDHSVIWADGMMTESYLDTGNRSTFRQEGAVVRLGQAEEGKDWASDAAAELAVSRAVVEPLFRQIERRAADAGLTDQSDVGELTHDADLHLVMDKGQSVRAARKQGDLVTFMLPVGVESVRIVSRTSRPSDVIGPFVDDRRDLGVLVGDVSLFDGAAFQNLTYHLDQADLDGWAAVEASACRWTNGNALLPLGTSENANLRLLTLKVLAAGPYLLKIAAVEDQAEISA